MHEWGGGVRRVDPNGNRIQNSCGPRHWGHSTMHRVPPDTTGHSTRHRVPPDTGGTRPCIECLQCLGLQLLYDASHDVLVGKCRGIGESGDTGQSASMCMCVKLIHVVNMPFSWFWHDETVQAIAHQLDEFTACHRITPLDLLIQ